MIAEVFRQSGMHCDKYWPATRSFGISQKKVALCCWVSQGDAGMAHHPTWSPILSSV